MGKGGSKQTIGYKYYLGEHMVLTHGPADFVSAIKVDKRLAWAGQNTGSSLTIDAKKLFGGDDREGGISGKVDICMGAPDQLQNAYLISKLGSQVPAYRGVVSAILNQCYVSNNPYLKPWSFRMQRIFKAQDGEDQWYPEKAAIPVYSNIIAGTNSPTYTSPIAAILAAKLGLEGGDTLTETVNVTTQNIDIDSELNAATTVAGGLTAGITVTANPSDILVITTNHDGPYIAYSVWGVPSPEDAPGHTGSTHRFNVIVDGDVNDTEISGSGVLASGYEAARAEWEAMYPNGYVLSGGSSYTFYVLDEPITDNTGGMSLTIKKYPSSFNDMNPAHIIRECLTNQDWGMGYPAEDMDDSSFTTAADTLYLEGLGMSLLWDKQTLIDEFIQQVVRHIDAALYVSRDTGKFVLKLIRADYDVETLIELNESNIAKVSSPSWPAFGELLNSITVNYWDSATGNDASRTVQDPALVQMQGQVLGTTVQYPGFTNERNAVIAGQRDLRSLSSRILSCTIYADETAKDLNIGDCFKFSWAAWRVESMVMRVIGIAFGDGKNNQVRITCTEDIFTTPDVIVVGDGGDGWIDPTQPATTVPQQIAFELPYHELVQFYGQTTVDSNLATNPEVGYVGAAAVRAESAINARVWTDPGSGYEEAGSLDFCAYAELTDAIDPITTVVSFSNAVDLDDAEIGIFVQFGDGAETELCVVNDIDLDLSTVTLGRGCLDTTPKAHIAGTKMFFWDPLYGVDPVEYVDGETIGVKITPTTGLGSLDVTDAVAMSVTLDQRAIRPYAPGDLRVQTESYLDGPYDGELAISWTHRDRTQQTGGTIYDHTFGDIGPEAGVEYRLTGYDPTMTLIHTEDNIVGTSTVWEPTADGYLTIKVASKRDGLDSWQSATTSFFYSSTSAFAIDGANYNFSGKANYPAAFRDSVDNKSWIFREAWDGVERFVALRLFDHTTKRYSKSYIVSTDMLTNDGHGHPVGMIDHEGYVHCFFKAHNSALKHFVTANPRDPTEWIELADIGTDVTYPKPILVGSDMYLFLRSNTAQDYVLYKTTALSGGVATFAAPKTLITFTGGRVYAGQIHLVGTNLHFIATYADAGDTLRRDIYHYIYDTTDGSIKNSDSSVSTASGAQPISKATSDTSYIIFNQTTNQTDLAGSCVTPDGKFHIGFLDGAASPWDIKHMSWSAGVWSAATTVASTTGRDVSAGFKEEIGVVPFADNSIEIWFANDPTDLVDRGGSMYRIARTSAGVWGSINLVRSLLVIGLARPSPVFNADPELYILFTEEVDSELDIDIVGSRAWAWGNLGYVPLFSPVFDTQPVISNIDGFFAEGDVLNVASGEHNGDSSSYQWNRDGVAIGGATSSSYLLDAADVGAEITVTQTASNFVGDTDSISDPVGPIGTPVYATETRTLSDTTNRTLSDTTDRTISNRIS